MRHVEVLKGPAGFLHGGNPLSGAVLLERKQPQATRFADVAAGYGRYGTFEAALDANAATADQAHPPRLNAVWQGSDGYRALPGGSIAAVNPTVVWRPDTQTRLFLDFELARSVVPRHRHPVRGRVGHAARSRAQDDLLPDALTRRRRTRSASASRPSGGSPPR